MATHASILAWRIPWTGEHGGLLSMGLHRIRHDWCDLAAATLNDIPVAQYSCWLKNTSAVCSNGHGLLEAVIDNDIFCLWYVFLAVYSPIVPPGLPFSTLPCTFWRLVSLADGSADRWLECSAGGSFLAGRLRSVTSLHQRPKMFLKHRPPTAVHSGSFCASVLSIVMVPSLLASPWEWHTWIFLNFIFYLNNSAHTFGKSLYLVTPFKGAVHFLLEPWLMTQFKKLAILKNEMQDNLSLSISLFHYVSDYSTKHKIVWPGFGHTLINELRNTSQGE